MGGNKLALHLLCVRTQYGPCIHSYYFGWAMRGIDCIILLICAFSCLDFVFDNSVDMKEVWSI